MKPLLSAILCVLAFLSFSCESEREPFTAEMRFFVDSVSGLRVRELRSEIDSQYLSQEKSRLPALVDSIYKVRRAQMEEKLKEFKNN